MDDQGLSGARPADRALSASQTAPVVAAHAGDDPSRMSHYEQMLDAQAGCVPCKLCGGAAIISDAGIGAGYYIRCENGYSFWKSKGCMISDRRLGGWAYNVRDWWNRLHAVSDRDTRRMAETGTGSVRSTSSASPQDIAQTPSPKDQSNG